MSHCPMFLEIRCMSPSPLQSARIISRYRTLLPTPPASDPSAGSNTTTMTTTSTTTETAATLSVGISGGASANDIQAYLSGHNTVRAQYGAANLTWSADLASKAQQWANGCKFQHSLGPFGGMISLRKGVGLLILCFASRESCGWDRFCLRYPSCYPVMD
jgi:uncharacterized protein YkwD